MPGRAVLIVLHGDMPAGRSCGPQQELRDAAGEGGGASGPPTGKNLRTRSRGLRGPPDSFIWELAQENHCGLGNQDEAQFAEMQTLGQVQTEQVCKNSTVGSTFERLGASLAGLDSARSFARLGLILAQSAGLSHAADYFKQVISLDRWDF